MSAVTIEHIDVRGWEPPHELRLELRGTITRAAGDDIVRVMHKHAGEFRAAVAPAIEAAFERVFLARMRDDGAPPDEPVIIEDIEL